MVQFKVQVRLLPALDFSLLPQDAATASWLIRFTNLSEYPSKCSHNSEHDESNQENTICASQALRGECFIAVFFHQFLSSLVI